LRKKLELSAEHYRDIAKRLAGTANSSEAASVIAELQKSFRMTPFEAGRQRRAVIPAGREETEAIRNQPGTPHGGESLPAITENWFPERRNQPGTRDYRELPIPGQIAARLRKIDFKNFRDFRSAFWKLVSLEPGLVSEFNYHPHNANRMRNGQPPFVPGERRAGRKEYAAGITNAVYQIDHLLSLQNEGWLYDLDNMAIKTFRFHVETGE
jgi:hypothetical protein